jgi:soluble lytic murein transglycosylase-like protein
MNKLIPIIVVFLSILSTPMSNAELPKIRLQGDGEPFAKFCYALVIAKQARELDIPLRIAVRLAYYESQWNYMAISDKGAEGLYQLMPEYHDYFKYKFNAGKPFYEFKPKDSIKIGLSYLKYLYGKMGTWRTAIMAYNCGENFRNSYGYWPEESIRLADNVIGDKNE